MTATTQMNLTLTQKVGANDLALGGKIWHIPVSIKTPGQMYSNKSAITKNWKA